MNGIQLAIIITTALGLPIVLSMPPATRWHRVGCAILLLGQPLWIYETLRTGDQFGMFIVAIWLTGWYAFGLLRASHRTNPDLNYIDLQEPRWPHPDGIGSNLPPTYARPPAPPNPPPKRA